MVPAIKVFDIDYSFIIKNYLDKSLWNKTWTIFIYKDFVFTIRLSEIHVANNVVEFKVALKDHSLDDGWINAVADTVSYCIDREPIMTLLRRINRRCKELIETYEARVARRTSEYEYICEVYDAECEKLTEIAKDFLDENGVTNESIRDAYIENYVDKNENSYAKKERYVKSRKYKELPDLHLVFAKAIDDQDLIDSVMNSYDDDTDNRKIKEAKEYMEYMDTEEFMDDKINCLEEI